MSQRLDERPAPVVLRDCMAVTIPAPLVCHYFAVPHSMSPADAWKALKEGNERFVSGQPLQPNQGAGRREEVSVVQNPHAVLFGCSDSRLAAEIIFDQGLGDMFVVRTAGQVVDPTVLGSIEYGVDILEVPLIVVLVHSNCGAIGATEKAWQTGELPAGFIRTVVDRIMPTIARVHVNHDLADITDEMLRREHVSATVQTLQSYSRVLARAVDDGSCAIVGLEYDLSDGRVTLVEAVGEIGEEAAS